MTTNKLQLMEHIAEGVLNAALYTTKPKYEGNFSYWAWARVLEDGFEWEELEDNDEELSWAVKMYNSREEFIDGEAINFLEQMEISAYDFLEDVYSDWVLIPEGRTELDDQGNNLYKVTISRALFDAFEHKLLRYGTDNLDIDFDSIPTFDEYGNFGDLWDYIRETGLQYYFYNDEIAEEDIKETNILNIEKNDYFVSFLWVGGIGCSIHYQIFGQDADHITIKDENNFKWEFFRQLAKASRDNS